MADYEEKNGFKFIKNFCKHKAALAALIILILEILAVIFLPLILKLDPYTIDSSAGFNMPPSAKHILGTDDVGRDMFSRLIYGGRVSIFVGFFSTLISLVIGLPLGLLAGYYKGICRSVIMRFADICMAIPSIIFALVIVAIFGQSIMNVTLVIGVLGWTAFAKLIYGNVLSVSQSEYIEAAKTIGTSNRVIILKYILPNVISPVWVSAAFRISQAIIQESALSFLGAGVQPPQASWGNIIYSAQKLVVLTNRPWIWIPPGICLVLTIISINMIGEGVRDALDPKTKR